MASGKIISLSTTPSAERLKSCLSQQINPEHVDFIEGDSTQPNSWENETFHHDVVIVQASDRFTKARDADAATLAILAVARAASRKKKPIRYLVELLELHPNVLNGMAGVEALPTSQFMAHMLAQGAMRPELIHVYHSIFDPEKFRLTLVPLHQNDQLSKNCTFKHLAQNYSRSGQRLLGLVRDESSELVLANNEKSIDIRPKDSVLILQPVK